MLGDLCHAFDARPRRRWDVIFVLPLLDVFSESRNMVRMVTLIYTAATILGVCDHAGHSVIPRSCRETRLRLPR